MIQFYTHMQGPIFLVVYATIGVVFFLICMSYRAAIDLAPDPKREKLKPEVDPDPYKLAYLRGGNHEVLRMATFELFSKGLLQETKPFFAQPTLQVLPGPTADVASLSDYAKEAKRFYQEPRTHAAIFASDVGTNFRQRYLEWDDWIDQEGLRIPVEYQRKLNRLAFGLAIVFLALGLVKILSAVSRGHGNVLFTVEMMIVGAIAMALTRSPRRFSLRGREFLKGTQLINEQHRNNVRKFHVGTEYPAAADAAHGFVQYAPLMAMGIFGVAALQNSEFDGFRKSYLKSQSTGSGCGSSCAGAISSCGGSTESHSGCGSSDSGGSGGCGSGCGGCGGGGCGGGGD